MKRRDFLAAALVSPFALAGTTRAQTQFIADMHMHSFFAESHYHLRPLRAALTAGGATLTAWALVGDLLWLDTKTYKQSSEPRPGEAYGWFQRELGRIKAHILEQKLKIVRQASDIDEALRGSPHIVLAVEGAGFIENDIARVKAGYDLGLRHMQLVHYTRNTVGGFQTDSSDQGLTEFGKQVVMECNRLGILVDLAHCTDAAVRDALSISRAPVVWSHGSVARGKSASSSGPLWRRRQISLDIARAIALKGGVVGLWSLATDVGKGVEAYGDRMLELAEWLGEDHVAFGTDINGLGPFGTLSGYADLRRVVDYWQHRGVSETRIAKLSIGNYARVLRAAFNASQK